MTPALRAVVYGAALVLATHAQSTPPSPLPRAERTEPPAHTNFFLEAGNGAFHIRVPTFGNSHGRPFTVDPSRLHFTISSIDVPGPPRPFAAHIGAPTLIKWYGTPMYDLLVVFPRPPEHAGMFRVTAEAQPGLARYEDGAHVPVNAAYSADVYWPDEAGSDSGLRAARARIANRTVYGFGGIALSCGARSSRGYTPNVGVTIRSVERRRGTVQRLWTGALARRGDDSVYSFLAVDPLAVRAAYPATAIYGSSSAPDEPVGDAPCPGFFLADPWHVDVSLTSKPPPRLPRSVGIAAGMSRDEVVWLAGYPSVYGTVASFRAQDHWDYDAAPPFQWSVTFAHDRVIKLDPPGKLP